MVVDQDLVASLLKQVGVPHDELAVLQDQVGLVLDNCIKEFPIPNSTNGNLLVFALRD